MGVHLLTGDDESILRSKAHDLVSQLVGDGDRSLLVDEFDGEEYELREAVDAAQTLPFLTDRRVVVARDVGRFNADDLASLLGYLDNPLETTDLVLVAGGAWGWASATEEVPADLGAGFADTTVTIPGGFWLASFAALFLGIMTAVSPRRAGAAAQLRAICATRPSTSSAALITQKCPSPASSMIRHPGIMRPSSIAASTGTIVSSRPCQSIALALISE